MEPQTCFQSHLCPAPSDWSIAWLMLPTWSTLSDTQGSGVSAVTRCLCWHHISWPAVWVTQILLREDDLSVSHPAVWWKDPNHKRLPEGKESRVRILFDEYVDGYEMTWWFEWIGRNRIWLQMLLSVYRSKQGHGGAEMWVDIISLLSCCAEEEAGYWSECWVGEGVQRSVWMWSWSSEWSDRDDDGFGETSLIQIFRLISAAGNQRVCFGLWFRSTCECGL